MFWISCGKVNPRPASNASIMAASTATEIFTTNRYDIVLVQRLLQHGSAATTQQYIGIEPRRIEQAIENHSVLI